MTMSLEQQNAVLRAIAISSSYHSSFSAEDRLGAYRLLEEFKRFDGGLALCVSWLQADHHNYLDLDITVATKLLCLEVISTYLQKGYARAPESDRASLRTAVMWTARLAAAQPMEESTRILAKKIAAVIEGVMIRDFPQRWTNLADDLFSPRRNGGLWLDEPGEDSGSHIGVQICLECLKLVAEDCTDSDFNVKISTARRNDVLIGLNEMSVHFLPLLFQLLEHYSLLYQAKVALHNMHTYLLSMGRGTSSMTPDETKEYQKASTIRKRLAILLCDTLTTLERFCSAMPVAWMLGGSHDFLHALMHLLREPDAGIQIKAVECLEQLSLRGKLDFHQWMKLVVDIPPAVQDTNQIFAEEMNRLKAEQLATQESSTGLPSPAMQALFYRALSRLLASVLYSHISHFSSSKALLNGSSENYNSMVTFLRLLVQLLHHPSGRVCTEQLNMWTALLRDPQISKSPILQPFLQDILNCYMDQFVRITWEEVEESKHPHTSILEASFDDEDDYDTWMADLRSRSSLLFKFSASIAPHTTSQAVNARIQSLLANHGNGEPLIYLDAENKQLTVKSPAVTLLEGATQPLENILSGIPSWAMEANPEPFLIRDDGGRRDMRVATIGALSELATSLVKWNPTYVWLKFRRAALLDALRYFWKYDPSTLLQGVRDLFVYLGLQDEWRPVGSNPTGELSGEIVGLKKKSGVALVSIAKKVPEHLVPWLSQLSEVTGSLLSSDGLIPLNQMHLYEFLTCVATAVDDPNKRAQFIGEVLSNAVQTLNLTDVQNSVSSVAALLTTFGVDQASERADIVSDPAVVKVVRSNYHRLFTALNRLLSVGRRCHESARLGVVLLPVSESDAMEATNQQSFADEGPVSVKDLAIHDPFVPLWVLFLHPLLSTYEAVLGAWRAEHQAVLLRNPLQRYVYAISDDEAFLARTYDSKSGGVFGEGGTAGSVVAGTDRRDLNLVPKWSGWFNELRNTSFQLIGLLAADRALYSPELANYFPRLVSVLTDRNLLMSMEHRHFIQFLKHVLEIILLSCPSTLYKTHLEPIASPIFEHIRFRLDKSWRVILDSSKANQLDRSTLAPIRALTSQNCQRAADLALTGGESWFTWFYAHGGLFVGDLDEVTAEAAVEKGRVDLTRTYCDMLQVVLALKGDWALVLANQAKEEQAQKRNEPSKLLAGPRNRLHEEGVQLNADGTPKSEHQDAIDARKLQRINGLCHFLLLESEMISGNIILSAIQCLGYPDAYSCRRTTNICHRILETVAWSPVYSQILGQHMFTQAIKNIVTEPKWMVGVEWDMINVIRDIYCRLVLGQYLQPGGQGPGVQQPSHGANANHYEQSKIVDRPLQGGGILMVAADYPRQFLASLPGVGTAGVEQFERSMKTRRSAKDQKDCLRELLRTVSDHIRDMNPTSEAGTVALGAFDRAIEEESLLHTNSRQKAIPDIPEKFVTKSQLERQNRPPPDEPEGLSSFKI